LWLQGTEHKFQPFVRRDIEIGENELKIGGVAGSSGGEGAPDGGVDLCVRRGSEPALNRFSPPSQLSVSPDPSKRWSAAPLIDEVSQVLIIFITFVWSKLVGG